MQVLSVSDARPGMLNACKQHCILCTVSYLCSVRLRKRGKLINACKQHCILCTVSYLCSVRLRKRGKLIQEMSESKSLRES